MSADPIHTGVLPSGRSHLELVRSSESSGLVGHEVCFYDGDRFPARAVGEYLAASIRAGGAAVAIATPSHLSDLRDVLTSQALDVPACTERKQLVLLDAHEVLKSLHAGDQLSKASFDAVIAPLVAQCLADFSRVSAFGEMVDVLYRSGKPDAALELEGYWNELRERMPFGLLCAYAFSSFQDGKSLQQFTDVCSAHGHVEASPSVDGNVDAGRLRAHFEQRSRALEHEVERCQELELECHRLLKAERTATEHAHSAHRHLALLQRVTSALSEAATRADVCHVLRTELAEAVDAAGVCLATRRDGDLRLQLFGPDGAPSRPCRADSPLVTAFETARPVWPGDGGAWAALPLIVATRTIGAVGLDLGSDAPISIDGRALLEDLARQLALALDRVELYEVSREARERAERANVVKDELLAMLGHELRNPLSPMLTALQLMHLRAGDVAVKERAVIERQVRHMVRLVDDLLDISRITRGTLTLSKQPIELAEVVASAIEIASPLLEERAHRLTTAVPTHGCVVHADPHRLAQAIGNLLTNAAKYTERGGRIDVRATSSAGVVELAVRDDGAGVDPVLLPQIFDRFVQGRQDIDRRAGGLGLGLAIVRQLVELHGGSVRAESQGRKRGSTFTIQLPLRDTGTGASEGSAIRLAGSEARVDPNALRILVVDDNADAAEMLAEVLGADGHVVRVANDGPSAIEVAVELAPDVALLDIGLPVMDGFELAEQLKKRLTPLPLLMALTGYGQPADIARTRAAGFDEHFTKPLEIDRLRKRLQSIVTP